MIYTIGQLCDKFEFSRSTLLYYDTIGLLKPSTRTAANYRQYSEEDLHRLQRIYLYRQTGMPLNQIQRILESNPDDTDGILEKQLAILNQSIRKLEIQRQIIIRLITGKGGLGKKLLPAKEAFTKVLYKTGLNDEKLAKLHREFEQNYPQEHQAFLEFLGIPPDEIKKLRKNCNTF